MRRSLLLAAIGLLVSPALSAAPTRVSPMARLLLAHHARTHTTFPTFVASRELESSGKLPVVVRLASGATAGDRARLAARGVDWTSERASVSGAYFARVDLPGLAALDLDAIVLRVTPDLAVRSPRPLDKSAQETRIDVARRALRAKDGTLLDGTGTTIGDVDSGVFVFHPALFRGDGGVLPWVDVNGDGTLSPGVDGVDIDQSGTIEPTEILQELRADIVDIYKLPYDVGTAFRPDRDYLYLDSNGNGRRDWGKGFPEDTPAYGEPIFVFDDANANGAMEPSERLVRLGTSKIRAVRAGTREYVRGGTGSTGLSQLPTGTDPASLEEMGHGTGVAGILVGGMPGISRYLGLAPGADLVVGTQRAGTVSQLQWAISKKADVLLTEYAPYAGVSLDGSSEDDKVIDSAFAKGILTSSPAGNLADAKKHRTIALAAGSNTITIAPDADFAPAHLLELSVHHRALGRMLSLELVMPDTSVVVVPANELAGQDVGGGVKLYAESSETPKGTVEHHVQLYRPSGALPQGNYLVRATLDPGAGVETDWYVGDDVTSWARGAVFDQNTASRTICEPATAESAISVAAYVLHGETEFYPFGAAGELAGYSSRGPLLAGAPGIEIAAPDNPMTIAPPLSTATERPAVYGPFGGTSGAGPHVAAAIALLRQLYPTESAAELRDRLVNNARHDQWATVEAVETFGRGKLDLAKAAGLEIASGTPPSVDLVAPAAVEVGSDVALDPRVQDDGPQTSLAVRWDLDYDGKPDTDWEPLAVRKIAARELGWISVKVEVRDTQGNVAADTALVHVTEAKPAPPPNVTTPPPPPGGCGCTTTGGDERGGLLSVVAIAASIVLRRRRTIASAG